MSNGHSVESDGGSSPDNMSSSEGYGQLDPTVAEEEPELAVSVEHAKGIPREHNSDTTAESEQGHGRQSEGAEQAAGRHEVEFQEDDPKQPELDWRHFQQLCGQQMDKKRQEQRDLQHELDELISVRMNSPSLVF